MNRSMRRAAAKGKSLKQQHIKIPVTMRERLGASATGAGQAEIEALRAEVDRLAEALRGWWEAHRPVGWTEDQHRSCPHVNLATDAEKALATALLRDQEEGK